MAAVDVLERLGYAVDFPEKQTCCGQPAFNTGYREEAQQVACQCLEVLRDAEYIVVPSGSCASMITHHYPELFAGDSKRLEETRRLAPRVWEFSKFLIEVAGAEDVGARYDGVVTFHDSCHGLRELNIKEGPRRLLSRVKGLTLREMDIPEECCGFGGTFSVKFGEISTRLADDKCRHVEASGADAVVLGDLGCMLNIEGRLRRRGHASTQVLHIAEVLAGERP